MRMEKESCVLVCVTGQRGCDRLIRRGREIAVENFLPLHVLHVRTGKTMLGNADVSEALNYLYGLARDADAEMDILSSQDVRGTLCKYARAHGARYMVLGVAPGSQGGGGLIAELQNDLPNVCFEVCDA